MGVDACKSGWVGIVIGEGERGYYAATIAELAAAAEADGQLAAIVVDMPIGLPDRTFRQADVLAANEVGKRRSSVFTTPVRAAVEAADYATASALNRDAGLGGISKQAHGLRTKVLEVDQWMRDAAPNAVEGHPEVSFARLAGSPLPHAKKTWAGMRDRRELLASAGIRLAGDLGEAGRQAAVDDVLDAAVLAWTARRVAEGEAVSYPDPPEVFSDGIPAAIWA